MQGVGAAADWLLAGAVAWFVAPALLRSVPRTRDSSAAVWGCRALLLAVLWWAPDPYAAPTVRVTLSALAAPTLFYLGGVAAGLLCGTLGSGGLLRSVPARTLLSSLPPAVVLVLPAAALPTSPWDALVFAALAGAGIWSGSAAATIRVARSRTTAVGYAAFFTALLLETAVRGLLPPPQPLPPPTEARRQATTTWDPRCMALFPQVLDDPADPDSYAARTARAGGRRYHVLHVGDSLTEGVGVAPAERFTSLLEAGQPDVVHINAGYGATGTDFHVLVVDRWLALLRTRGIRPDLVIVHYFDNDPDDLANHYSCCGDNTLIRWGEGGWALRCPEPTRAGALVAQNLRAAPAPYLLRATAWISHASAHLTLRMWAVDTGRTDNEKGDKVARLLADLHRSLGEQDIALIVNSIGLRSDDVGLRDLDATAMPPLAALAGAGVAVTDSDAALLAAHSVEELVRMRSGDGVHYSPEGHRAVADWLGPLIRSQLEATSGSSR